MSPLRERFEKCSVRSRLCDAKCFLQYEKAWWFRGPGIHACGNCNLRFSASLHLTDACRGRTVCFLLTKHYTSCQVLGVFRRPTTLARSHSPNCRGCSFPRPCRMPRTACCVFSRVSSCHVLDSQAASRRADNWQHFSARRVHASHIPCYVLCGNLVLWYFGTLVPLVL